MTSVKLEKGVFSSTILIRAPGLSEMSRVSRYSGLVAWGRGRRWQIDALPKGKEKSFYNYQGRDRGSQESSTQSATTIVNQQISIADELAKLATQRTRHRF